MNNMQDRVTFPKSKHGANIWQRHVNGKYAGGVTIIGTPLIGRPKDYRVEWTDWMSVKRITVFGSLWEARWFAKGEGWRT